MEIVALMALFAVMLAAGCSPPPPCVDGSCELLPDDQMQPYRDAAAVVHAFYGTHQELPALMIYLKGDCQAIVSVPTGAKAIPGGKINVPAEGGGNACVYGAWYPQDNTIYMTTVDWQTTIAHELLHQRLNELYGDPDYNHTRQEWKVWLPAALDLIKGQTMLGSSQVLVVQPKFVDRYVTALKTFLQIKAPKPRVVFFAKGDCDFDPDDDMDNDGLRLHGGRRRCTPGTYLHPPTNEIHLMNKPGWLEKLAHEMLHQKLLERYGDGDAQHQRSEWRTVLPLALVLVRSM